MNNEDTYVEVKAMIVAATSEAESSEDMASFVLSWT